MIRILTRRRNVYLLGSVLFVCQVYINYKQLRSVYSPEIELLSNQTQPKDHAAFTELHKQTKSIFGTQSVTVLPPVYQDRRHQFEHTCSDNVSGSVDRVIQYHNVSYCVTHKIASTFWIRIFRYLYNDTKRGHVESPFDISKYDTHLLKYRHIKEIPLNSMSEKEIFSTFRFMFVREPFARLWSVYIDKFLLPDNFFWNVYGQQIKALRPKRQLRSICDPVSFPEFLNFIVKYGTDNAAKLDDHYRPVHYGCNPCKFKPDFVGKLETMADDSRYVLTRLGLSWVADVHSHEERVKEEISMLIDFNYELVIKRNLLARCVSVRTLADKLWRAFQINGYIPRNTTIILSKKDLKDKNKFMNFVWKTFKESKRTSDMMKTQRKSMMLEAYTDVPLETLKGIQRVFREDFELFGYNPQPEDIFSAAIDRS